MNRRMRFLQAMTVLFVFVPFLLAQEKHGHNAGEAEELGVVNFPVTSTRPSTQQEFNRAMALLHSFVYDEAMRAFTDLSLRDPQCAMAYWGIAMSYFHPLWESPSSDDIQKAMAAIQKAKYVGGKTERELAYITAIETIFKDADKIDHRTRALAYEQSMEQLSQKYPDDTEAAILYALALNATALKTDKTYANNKKAGEILQKIFAQQPRHPGVAHYIIHSFDSPVLANLAVNAARRYAQIAPAAPHALHMPSHIFVRLGLWQDNIETNIASANAGTERAHRLNPELSSFDAFHAWDYIMYGYLQSGQDKAAQQLIGIVSSANSFDRSNLAAAYALAAIPTRFALERRDWSGAASLVLQPSYFPWNKFPWAEAIVVYGRALGSARGGDPVAARKNAEQLRTLIDASSALKDAYWANQVEILYQSALAWIAHAEGNDDEALKMMRAAADAEDATDKHPVTPGSILPQRELLGEMLLEVRQPAEALKQFKTSLASTPNRFNGLYGAARAAEAAGNTALARSYFERLLTVCSKRDAERPEILAAKKFLAIR